MKGTALAVALLLMAAAAVASGLPSGWVYVGEVDADGAAITSMYACKLHDDATQYQCIHRHLGPNVKHGPGINVHGPRGEIECPPNALWTLLTPTPTMMRCPGEGE